MRDPCLYTQEELRTIAQTNNVPDWDTMDIRALCMHLWDNGFVTQEQLNSRQDAYRAMQNQ